MATEIRNRDEIYEIYKNAAQATNPNLTDWREGSINDALAGGCSAGTVELIKVMLLEFAKTFFNTAEGDELEALATDHFGSSFARPEAQKAVGIVTFSRVDDSFGNCIIPAGTVVKTSPDANGQVQRFVTDLEVLLTGLSINASVTASVAGTAGNVDAGDISEIESTLLDSTIEVTNSAETSGGTEEETDGEYRETIIRLIQELKGATLPSIRSKLLNVPGIEIVTTHEQAQTVIEWNEATETPIGEAFRIPWVKAYIADANGTANDALLQNAIDAVLEEKAAGVKVDIYAAEAVALNWSASMSLNPSGPNYSTLASDSTMIVNSMTDYINNLNIGSDFNRSLAEAAILAIWGSAGTDDLTAFTTNLPTGDISTAENEKLIPGTVEID